MQAIWLAGKCTHAKYRKAIRCVSKENYDLLFIRPFAAHLAPFKAMMLKCNTILLSQKTLAFSTIG